MKRWLRAAACALFMFAGAVHADDVTIVSPPTNNGVIGRSDEAPPGDTPAPKRGAIRNFFSKHFTLTGGVRTDDVTVVPPATSSAPIVQPGDGMPVDGYAAPVGGRFRAFFNKIGVCCFHDRDAFGCESFHSEMQFIFGSCRTFFDEPCEPKPPRDGGLLGRYGSGPFGSGSFGLGRSGCTSCGGW